MYKKSLAALLAAAVIVLNVFTTSAATSTKQECSSGIGQPVGVSGYYIHDPMENPKAAADIVVNPNAVYGYSPNPDSTRLGVYAQYDWSDKAFVAEMKKEREEYHESVKELYQMKANMEAEGKSVEEIARAVSTRRNEIRMEAYKDDPEGLEKLKESNLATFGNENGGTPEYFFEKYGSWEAVIEKAFSTNAGADACLGLYDKYYDTYIIPDTSTQPVTEPTQTSETTEPTESVTESQPQPETTEPASSESSQPVTEATEPTSETTSMTDITEPTSEAPAATDAVQPTTSVVKKSSKKANPLKVSVRKINLKLKKLKSKKQKVKPLIIKNAKGGVKISIIKSGTTANIRKKISINKNIILTFKKGKYSKTTYKIKLKIYVKGNTKYKPKTIYRMVKVKVK